ncbi:MAG: class I SAM-dependent methyltransferase [Acidobacteriota bacterium]
MGKIAVKNKTWTRDNFPVYLTYEHLDLDLRSRILDVGCGAGRLLNLLNYYGFKNLTGADVFIEQDIKYANGVKIHKRELDDVEGTFDLIMFHHSLEHFVEPRAALKNAHSLLQKRKYCVVRIPVAAYAWEKYGRNWVQLDAPRHINLFTEASFRRMAREIGFDVENVVYDSTAFQFVGSEQYVRDIPLAESFEDSDTFLQNLFGKEQLTEWGEEAEKLNADHRGDQACFYLKKA